MKKSAVKTEGSYVYLVISEQADAIEKSLKHSFRKDGNGDGFQQHSLFVFLHAVMPPSLLCGALFLEEWSPPSFQPGFYAWGEPVYILLMLFASTVDYTNGRLMTRFGSTEGRRRLFLCCSVIINLSVLGFFKYADFLIDTVNGLFHTGLRPLGLGLPVGISFSPFRP